MQAGQYMLVKAFIAGTIVTNTLFMLGASFLLGGIKHHVQEFNRAGARLQANLLFMATVALFGVLPAMAKVNSTGRRRYHRQAERRVGSAPSPDLRTRHGVFTSV